MMDRKLNVLGATAILLLSMVGITQAAFLTTGTYDENIVNTNVVDTLAASSNRTLAEVTADLAAAFAANLGGVVDFETVDADTATSLVPGDPGQASYKALFGIGNSKALTVTRTNYVVGPPAANGMNQNTANERISGNAAMGLSGSGAYTLVFSSPLKEWAMTAMSRTGDRTGVLTITHTDSSTYAFASQNPSADVTGVGLNDTLFAYNAPAGKYIASVNWNGPFLRWDDMAFVVPEPASLTLVALSAVALVGRRRQKS